MFCASSLFIIFRINVHKQCKVSGWNEAATMMSERKYNTLILKIILFF
jgi:hypothetical protein